MVDKVGQVSIEGCVNLNNVISVSDMVIGNLRGIATQKEKYLAYLTNIYL